MPVKRRRAKSKPKKILKPEFSPQEVASLELQAARHQQSESAWQRLASPPEGEDRWGHVEEHFLYKTQAHQRAERRWKYFGK